MSDRDDEERNAFEAHHTDWSLIRHGVGERRDNPTTYHYAKVEKAWKEWQAAYAAGRAYQREQDAQIAANWGSLTIAGAIRRKG